MRWTYKLGTLNWVFSLVTLAACLPTKDNQLSLEKSCRTYESSFNTNWWLTPGSDLDKPTDFTCSFDLTGNNLKCTTATGRRLRFEYGTHFDDFLAEAKFGILKLQEVVDETNSQESSVAQFSYDNGNLTSYQISRQPMGEFDGTVLDRDYSGRPLTISVVWTQTRISSDPGTPGLATDYACGDIVQKFVYDDSHGLITETWDFANATGDKIERYLNGQPLEAKKCKNFPQLTRIATYESSGILKEASATKAAIVGEEEAAAWDAFTGSESDRVCQ